MTEYKKMKRRTFIDKSAKMTAVEKIAYLAADHLKKKGVLKDSNVEFLCAKPVIFGVPHFQGPLNEIC